MSVLTALLLVYAFVAVGDVANVVVVADAEDVVHIPTEDGFREKFLRAGVMSALAWPYVRVAFILKALAIVARGGGGPPAAGGAA